MSALIWTGQTSYGGSAILAFTSPTGTLSVPSIATPENTVTLVFVSAFERRGAGITNIDEFSVRDSAGNDLPFYMSHGNSSLGVVPNWPVASGGTIRIVWDVGFSAVAGVLIGALFAADLDHAIPPVFAYNAGSGETASVDAQVPSYDMILASGSWSLNNVHVPEQGNADWTDVVSFSDTHHTVFNDQIFGVIETRATISQYVGPPGAAVISTPRWVIAPSATWEAATLTTPVFFGRRDVPLLTELARSSISARGYVVGPV